MWNQLLKIVDKVEQFRHNTFGTDPNAVKAAEVLDKVSSKYTPVGVMEEGGMIAGEALGGKLGLPAGLGGLLMGVVLPGGGEAKALKKLTKAKPAFKTDALARSKAMQKAGYTMEGFPSVQTRTNALEAGYPVPEGTSVWNGDKTSLKAAGQAFLDKGGDRTQLKTVGVIPTTTNGRPDHLYNRKQGSLSIRGVAQEQNTKLNRDLNLVQQTDGASTFKNKKVDRPDYGVKQAEHHIRGAKQLDFLFEGADAATSKKLSAHATKRMKPTGDSKFNNADLPKKDVHDPLHAWQKEHGLDPVMDTNLKKIFGVDDPSKVSFEQRKMALDTYLDVISGAQEEKMFELMQNFNRKKLSTKVE